MIMASKRKNRGLSRKTAEKQPYDGVLIVCEGTKTEKNYFANLITHEKLSSVVNIEIIHGNGTDPVSVVNTAIEEREKMESHLPFDKVYCVIDRDEHKKFDDAQKLAKDNQINLIVSYPSFEYWYLCHFKYYRAPIVRTGKKSAGDNCVNLLNSEWKTKFQEDYRKNAENIYTKLFDFLETALKNAGLAKQSAEEDDEKNPSTHVDKLVIYLKNIKK